MFKKVRMVRETDEWVLEIAGHEIPMVALKSALTAMFIVILVYWALNLGQNTALAYLANIKTASTPHCQPDGTCTTCEPYISGNNIRFNCTTIEANTTWWVEWNAKPKTSET